MKYTTPEMEIVRFEAMEVIVASGVTGGDMGGNNNEEEV